jgi:hypothetical protein
MKNFLIPFFFIFSFQLIGQNDSLMPNLSAHYSIGCTTGDWPQQPFTTYHDIIFNNPDTNFDTIEVSAPFSAVFAKLYMDSSKVFIKRILEYDVGCNQGWSQPLTNEWELLYDFDLSVGDSAYSYYSEPYITGIEEVEIQGVFRKKFIIGEGIDYYIQGIGSVNHPLYPKMELFETGYDVCSSELYYSGPSIIDSISFSPNCEGGFLSSRNQSQSRIRVYPNPSDGNVKIQLPETHSEASIILVDVFGNILWQESVSLQDGKSYGLSLGFLSQGVYFINVRTRTKNFSSRLILN